MKSLFAYLKSKVFLLNLILALVSLPIVVWIIMTGLNRYTDNGNEEVLVELPVLKGLSLAEAELRLDALGLSYEVVDSTFVADLPLGAVVDQFPKPTLVNSDSIVLRKVKKNRKLFLTVNKQEKPQKNIGTFFGKNFKEIEMQLKFKGFKITDTVGVYEGIAPNCVVGIKLKGGKKLKEKDEIPYGSPLVIYVDKKGVNQIPITVPNLVGLSLKEAENKLKSLTLKVGQVTGAAGLSAQDSLIFKVKQQSPEANGQRLYSGGAVNIEISN